MNWMQSTIGHLNRGIDLTWFMAPGWTNVHVELIEDLLAPRSARLIVSGQYGGKIRREAALVDLVPRGKQETISALKKALKDCVLALDCQQRPAAAFIKA